MTFFSYLIERELLVLGRAKRFCYCEKGGAIKQFIEQFQSNKPQFTVPHHRVKTILTDFGRNEKNQIAAHAARILFYFFRNHVLLSSKKSLYRKQNISTCISSYFTKIKPFCVLLLASSEKDLLLGKLSVY